MSKTDTPKTQKLENPEAQGFKTNPDLKDRQHAPWTERFHSGLVSRLQDFTVQCEENNCPPSVGTFVGFDGTKPPQKQFNVCGAGVFRLESADDTAITARHCLPIQTLEKGMSCDGAGHFLFPATDTLPARVIPCQEIIDFSVAEQFDDTEGADLQKHADWV